MITQSVIVHESYVEKYASWGIPEAIQVLQRIQEIKKQQLSYPVTDFSDVLCPNLPPSRENLELKVVGGE